MRIVGRLFLVPLALLLGGLTALLVVVTIGQEQFVRQLHRTASEEALLGLLGLILKVGVVLLTPQIMIVPLLIAVGSEIARIRAVTFYVASFGVFGALIPLVARIETSAGGLPVWALFATSGFAAGFIYWLVAGRTAG